MKKYPVRLYFIPYFYENLPGKDVFTVHLSLKKVKILNKDLKEQKESVY